MSATIYKLDDYRGGTRNHAASETIAQAVERLTAIMDERKTAGIADSNQPDWMRVFHQPSRPREEH